MSSDQPANETPGPVPRPRGDGEPTYDLLPRTLPQTWLSRRLDAFVIWVGNQVAWLWIILVGVIVANVTLRYVFARGMVEFEELQWHLYAIGFMFGLSYCLARDSHVRVDVLHMHFPLRAKAWIELFGILIFMFPFIGIVIYFAIPFIADSIATNEKSPNPGGLPYWFIIKSFLLIAFIFIAIAAFSRLTRVTAYLFGLPRPLPPQAAAGQT